MRGRRTWPSPAPSLERQCADTLRARGRTARTRWTQTRPRTVERSRCASAGPHRAARADGARRRCRLASKELENDRSLALVNDELDGSESAQVLAGVRVCLCGTRARGPCADLRSRRARTAARSIHGRDGRSRDQLTRPARTWSGRRARRGASGSPHSGASSSANASTGSYPFAAMNPRVADHVRK